MPSENTATAHQPMTTPQLHTLNSRSTPCPQVAKGEQVRIELEAGMLPGYSWSMIEPSPGVSAATTVPTNSAEAPVVRVRSTDPRGLAPPRGKPHHI